MSTTTRRYGPYGPRVIEIARFMVPEIGTDLVSLLHEVDRRWPGLSLYDLIGALVLVEAITLTLETQGSA
jgi:hypothetical protein